MKKIQMLFIMTFLFFPVFSQETASITDTLRKDALNVFMTASDYFKKEIPYINYVRDRKVADVYIISTYESAGSGGYVTTFFIVGQGKYKGMADTLKCNISPDDTDDTQRAKEVKALKMGLMRYVAKTPLAQYMNINFSEPLSETVSTDKWINWVYSASLVHDQISLPMGDTSLEDVLLRRKMQATDYQYYTSFGFTYTFGSIYNNAVNPRFDY
jgi:hypothetical protein